MSDLLYKLTVAPGVVVLTDAETHTPRYLLIDFRNAWYAYEEPGREWRMVRPSLDDLIAEFKLVGYEFVDPPGVVRAPAPGESMMSDTLRAAIEWSRVNS